MLTAADVAADYQRAEFGGQWTRVCKRCLCLVGLKERRWTNREDAATVFSSSVIWTSDILQMQISWAGERAQ